MSILQFSLCMLIHVVLFLLIGTVQELLKQTLVNTQLLSNKIWGFKSSAKLHVYNFLN